MFTSYCLFAQAKPDSQALSTKLNKIDELLDHQTDSAYILIKAYTNLVYQAKNAYAYSRLNLQLARYFSLKGLNDSALKYSPLAIKFARASKDTAQIIKSYLAHARTLSVLNNHNEAINFCLQAQRFAEASKTPSIQIRVWHDLGFVYANVGAHEKAIYYYKRGLQLALPIKDTFNYANLSARIGGEYCYLKKYDSSLYYNLQGLKNFKSIHHKRGVGVTLTNLSSTYTDLKRYEKAIETAKQALTLREELGDMYAIPILKSSLAQTYLKLNNATTALKYALEAQALLDKQVEDINISIGNLEVLRVIYTQLHQYENALTYSERYINEKEKQFKNTNLTALNELQTRYELDKQEREIALLQLNTKRDREKTEAANHRRNIILGATLLGSLLISIFTFLLYKRVKLSHQQKTIIEKQKMLVDEKQKEIIDSINYAQTIQQAIIPSEQEISKELSDAFVIFKPKDIVSGDFYWFTKHDNDIYIVVADCTGHGVPGAFMSLMGVSYLNEIINESKISDTTTILNLLRDKLITTLNKTKRERHNREGMDVAIVHIQQQTLHLQFSAANNNTYILSKGELKELKGDKMPVGFYTEHMKSFTSQHYQLQKGDRVFMITDGLPDQFGGEKGKKFMYKRFEKLITENAHQPIAQVKKLLQKTISDWQGQIEQVDDITCLAFEI